LACKGRGVYGITIFCISAINGTEKHDQRSSIAPVPQHPVAVLRSIVPHPKIQIVMDGDIGQILEIQPAAGKSVGWRQQHRRGILAPRHVTASTLVSVPWVAIRLMLDAAIAGLLGGNGEAISDLSQDTSQPGVIEVQIANLPSQVSGLGRGEYSLDQVSHTAGSLKPLI